jgi:hypothetical protein
MKRDKNLKIIATEDKQPISNRIEEKISDWRKMCPIHKVESVFWKIPSGE